MVISVAGSVKGTILPHTQKTEGHEQVCKTAEPGRGQNDIYQVLGIGVVFLA